MFPPRRLYPLFAPAALPRIGQITSGSRKSIDADVRGLGCDQSTRMVWCCLERKVESSRIVRMGRGQRQGQSREESECCFPKVREWVNFLRISGRPAIPRDLRASPPLELKSCSDNFRRWREFPSTCSSRDKPTLSRAVLAEPAPPFGQGHSPLAD